VNAHDRGGPRELLKTVLGPMTGPAGYLWRATMKFVSPPRTLDLRGFGKNSRRASETGAQS
jgi:hypothetical protein